MGAGCDEAYLNSWTFWAQVRALACIRCALASHCSTMLTPQEAQQEALCTMWRTARRDGELSPASQATVHALKQTWEQEHGDKTYGKLTWIKDRVAKQGGGTPTTSAISQLIDKMGGDADWFPGKNYGARPGRNRDISELSETRCVSHMASRFAAVGWSPLSTCPLRT